MKKIHKYFLISLLLLFTTVLDADMYRRKEELKSALVCKTEAVPVNDEQLVKRVVKAYQIADKQHLGNSMWQLFFDQRHKPIHEIFHSGNIQQATYVLRNPGTNELFYGIDNLCASVLPSFSNIEQVWNNTYLGFDNLIRFGEAIGALTLDYPESYPYHPPRSWDINSVIEQIEKNLGVTLSFPNPYPDEWGTWTPRGVMSYRAIQSLYQAHLIKTLLKNKSNPKVLEIGAGLGRTAYFARLFGIKDYTIIDIPMVAAASSYFLGRTLGENQVLLLGETSDEPKDLVKILSPDQFLNGNEHYDLIINVDSLTEMDISNAKAYLNKIQKSTPVFVSINHESNPFTVNQLMKEMPKVKEFTRNYYWLRGGYCEEIYKFD